MIVRALNSSGDWTFGKGRNDYKKDLKAVTQCIDTRLNCYLGECFFAMTEGVDWFNLLGGKDLAALELQIRSRILNTEDVTGLKQLSLNLDAGSRLMTVQYEVQTSYGRAATEFQFDQGALV